MRETMIGNCAPAAMATSMLPMPDWLMPATASGRVTISFGPTTNESDGSVSVPEVPARWKINLPEMVLVGDGLRICTEVLKNEPALPGVEPTTGM